MNSAFSSLPSTADEIWPPAELNLAETSGLASAIYFDSGGHQLFGWFHTPPARTMNNVGLVICKPFGYEAICSHRGLRAFAEAAAALGVPTLRVDYLGTGDSAEIDPRADQLQVWTKDIVAAVFELRRRSGVQHVCLLGVRLGGLLATLAASECAAVTSLILIAPIVSGRRYLRSLRTTWLAASLGGAQSTSGAPAITESAVANPGSMEVSGFLFSADTLAALGQMDLNNRAVPSVSDMLVIDGGSLPGSSPWGQQIVGPGIRAKHLVLPGLVEMIMTSPQFAAIPQEMIAAVRDWLTQLPHYASVQCGGVGARYLESDSARSAAVMTLQSDGPTAHAPLTERPVCFGSDPVLFGIVAEPRQGEQRRRAVILLNAGADYHIGVNGMHVNLARDWARRGYVALRMDLAGLGDSDTRRGQPDNEVFPPAVLDDIRTAVEFLRGRYGAGDITLFGLCAGAYHALRAAAAGVPVNRILMVNPQNFFWKKGMTLNDLQLSEVVHNPGLYRRQMFSLAAWKRMLGGHVDIWRIAKIYFYRPLLALESTLRDMARRMHIRFPNDLGWELEEIYRRGVRIVFVFARGEPGIDLLKIEGGSSVKRLGDYCRIHIVEGANHIFSQSGPRAIMMKIISDELFART
jgi:alpha-beta hydrolase superfamily lysophospholipase